ncbi:hypothetical protein AJ78_06217 [Emergomyces pasteurianus Ep9510]|uniref:Endoplasmic reticulum junction formation protein lunapark n=1 Tax=Emergomyces pasteurianus Ep9510 TaxID=1447872 RepID=A0A1J9P9R6_9EURO|nr:hypothetical protein AJ78_06217 [Emergomyces pasteurianus Ep9510]
MVSLWPWKGSSTSPAEFEKTLSSLSAKIARATTRLDRHRQRSRRYRVLWTLYTSFAYLLYSIIIILVLGWHNWGPCEYTTLAGGPVVIYLVRFGLDKYYQYRISGTQSHLDELHRQRDATIEKLKEATKYNSTLQLLEKYGGESPKRLGPQTGTASGAVAGGGGGGGGGEGRDRGGAGIKKRDPRLRASFPLLGAGGRTGIPPPATANIPRKQPGSVPTTPIRFPPMNDQQNTPGPSNINSNPRQQEQPVQGPVDEPGFAANAFPPYQHGQQQAHSLQSHWYDRILDVLLGEDETLPQNRLALICNQCRLVNGQAAPGIRSLEEIGRWRCGSCGALNGEESETRKALAGIQEAATATDTAATAATAATNTNPNPNRGGQAARTRDRSQSHHPSLRPSDRGSRTGTDGAWEPISGRGSVSSEVDSAKFTTGDREADENTSILIEPTSSEGEEYYDYDYDYDGGVVDSDIEEEGEVDVEVEEAHEVDQDKEGEKNGLHKSGSGVGKSKKESEKAGRETGQKLGIDDGLTGIAARTRSKSPRKSP